MKLALERDALLAALSHAHRIVSKNDTIPILNTVVIRAADDRLEIRATNLEIVAETSCAALVEVEGEAAVPLAPLMLLLQRLPAGTAIRMDREGDTPEMAFHYRRSRITLPTLDPVLLTTFAIPDEVEEIELPASTLARLLDVPSHAADQSNPRLYAQGVHLYYEEDTDCLVGVATNAFQLTRVTAPATDSTRRIGPFTLALKPIAEIVKLAAGVGDDPIRLRVNDALLSIKAGGTCLTSKLIDCTYPAYRQLIPAETPNAATLAVDELRSALSRALILADDKDRVVAWQVADGVLTITGRSEKGGSVSETVEIEGAESPDFRINAARVIEALGALGGDVLQFGCRGPGQPLVMRSPSATDVTCLVSPMIS